MSHFSFSPSIDIIYGPMYCSKTTEVIRRLIVYHELGMKVLYINACIDIRSEKNFSTHNKTIGQIPFDSVKTDKLADTKVDDYNVIAVDEAQFFPNLKDTVLSWVKKDKIVIVAGLNGDFLRQPFGQILDLIPHAESTTHLTSFCMNCKKTKNIIRPASFTKRTVQSTEHILIGGKESYIPVCRQCYEEK